MEGQIEYKPRLTSFLTTRTGTNGKESESANSPEGMEVAD